MRFSVDGEYGNPHRLLQRKRFCARADLSSKTAVSLNGTPVTVTQNSQINLAGVFEIGGTTVATVNQTGGTNVTGVLQFGGTNVSSVTQTGFNNSNWVGQSGK